MILLTNRPTVLFQTMKIFDYWHVYELLMVLTSEEHYDNKILLCNCKLHVY